jgi:hypothetical protein
MAAKAEGDWEFQRILMLLARNLPRMEAGLDSIRQRLVTDEAGSQFFEALMQWSGNILLRGQQVLDANGYGRN